jgi:hypothetical protein
VAGSCQRAKSKELRAKSKELRAKGEELRAKGFALCSLPLALCSSLGSAGKSPLLIPRDDGVEWISLLERAFKHARPSQLQNQFRVRKGGLPALFVSSQLIIKPFNVKAHGFELES